MSKRFGLSALVIGGVLLVACQAVTPPMPATGLDADVAYLASPALGGRATGTPGSDSAAAYIARRYRALGLQPAFPCANPLLCSKSFFQFFNVHGEAVRNVGAIVAGADPAFANEFIVIGAHYDHLGRHHLGALDRNLAGIPHLGADDNASGTAGTLELARRFAAKPTRRSLLFLDFDAEEDGLVGSRALVANPPIPLRSITFMLNLDMIGRLRTDRLYVGGALLSPGRRVLLDSAAAMSQITLDWTTEVDGRSDQESFIAQQLPAVAFFTGFHPDYHTVADIAGRINSMGMRRVVDVAESFVRFIDDR